jgi:hypothetical protein
MKRRVGSKWMGIFAVVNDRPLSLRARASLLSMGRTLKEIQQCLYLRFRLHPLTLL